MNKSEFNIQGKIRVVCSYCQNKYKRIPMVTSNSGYKTCKHITHTVSKSGMNTFQ